jgi:hypothetical protein
VLEFHPLHYLSVELNGIYGPLSEHYTKVLGDGTAYSSVTYKRAATWQFPVLAKYRFRLGTVNGATADVGAEMHDTNCT